MELVSRSALTNIALVLSMGCAIISGIDMAFNVYSTEIKETFNLTQTQVEVLASLDGIGIGLCCLEIPMFLHFGYKVTFITTWLMTTLGSGFLSLASFAREDFLKYIWLIYIAQLIMATGNNMSFMVMTRAVMGACPSNQTGKLVAMFFAMACMGKIFFGGIMDIFFTNNLGGFFMTLSLLSAIVVGVNFRILLHLINSTQTDNDESSLLKTESQAERKELIVKNNNLTEDVANKGNESSHHVPLKEMLKSSFFHLLFWSVLAFYAIPFTIMNNITTIAISQRVIHPMYTVYIFATCIIFLRVSFGVILDKFPSTLFGFVLLLSGDFTLIVAILLVIFYLGPTTVYVISVLVGVSLGSGYTVCIIMLMKRYGKEHYNFLTCAYYGVFTISLTLVQLLFGFIYDSNVSAESENSLCFGRDCFYHTFIVMLVCAVISFAIKSIHFLFTLINEGRKPN